MDKFQEEAFISHDQLEDFVFKKATQVGSDSFDCPIFALFYEKVRLPYGELVEKLVPKDYENTGDINTGSVVL